MNPHKKKETIRCTYCAEKVRSGTPGFHHCREYIEAPSRSAVPAPSVRKKGVFLFLFVIMEFAFLLVSAFL